MGIQKPFLDRWDSCRYKIENPFSYFTVQGIPYGRNVKTVLGFWGYLMAL
jgi:hypothetical protein